MMKQTLVTIVLLGLVAVFASAPPRSVVPEQRLGGFRVRRGVLSFRRPPL